jgi:hypothetical protein
VIPSVAGLYKRKKMSRLIVETDEFLELERYIHHDPDSYSGWELDEAGNEKYLQEVHEAENKAFYEIRCRYRIDKKTGVVTYLLFE